MINEERIALIEEQIAALIQQQCTMERSIEVQMQMVEVGKKIINALEVFSWLLIGLKWVLKAILCVSAIWVSVKLLIRGLL